MLQKSRLFNAPSATLQLYVPWWMGQSSRLCMFLRCKVVEKSIEIPQLHSLGQIVDIPTIQSVQSTQSF